MISGDGVAFALSHGDGLETASWVERKGKGNTVPAANGRMVGLWTNRERLTLIRVIG